MNYLTYTFSSFERKNFKNYISQFVHNRKLSDIYHTHDFYEIIEIVEGTAEMILNETSYILNKDIIVFMRPGDRHRFINQSKNLKLFSFSVDLSEVELIINFYDGSLIQYLQSLEVPIFKNTQHSYSYCDFISEIKSYDYEYKYKMLLSGFIKIVADSKYSTCTKTASSVYYAMSEMKKDENLRIGINRFVELSGYSRAQLSRIIKKEVGLTLQQYISQLRLDAAYSMLIFTQEPIECISENVGYASLSHFCKIFTSKYHITPAVLRKTKSIFTV